MARTTPDDRVLTALLTRRSSPITRSAARCSAPATPSRPWTATTSPGSSSEHYHPANLVVVAAGGLDHARGGRGRRRSRLGRRPRRPDRRVAPAPLRPGPCRSPSCGGPPSRPTSAVAWRGLAATTPTATPSRSPTRCSAGASRAGCSRRSARSAAWPTRCSRRRRPTPSRQSHRATPARPPSVSTRCSVSPRGVLDDLAADGITDRGARRALGYLAGLAVARPRGLGSRMSRIGNSVWRADEVIAIDEHVAPLSAP